MRAFVRIARPVLAATAAAAVAVALAAPNSVAAQQDSSAAAAPANFHAWHDAQDFHRGTAQGVGVTRDGLRLVKAVGTTQYPDPAGKNRSYDYANWTSPTYKQGFGATQLVSSWNANTPAGTWLQVAMRGHTNTGKQTGWYIMGRWASGDSDIKRTSVDGQSDANGDVSVDTFESAKNVTLTDYQLRVTLYRASGSRSTPTVSMVGAMTSNIPDRFTVPTSPAAGAWGIELPVPRYSQDIHKGQYPQYDGGGEAWCSPTSTEMITEYWHKHPTKQQLAWVNPSYADPSVDYAARFTYDSSYQGTGNWPFNMAYAASYGLSAHVTRLHSLDDVEQYIKHGIPVAISVSFRADELTGSNYSTDGHLMVIIGFTKTGDVIVNDPASANDNAVRNVYQRSQLETVWERTERYDASGKLASGSGGVAYIITPKGYPFVS